MGVFDLPFTPEQINEILDDYFEHVAKRQYTGARYVPIFGRKDEESVQWDNSAAYEPLTIVLYQGNSFTSRQYVPAGVSIDDGLYWAETGNYNGQIEQYRQEVHLFDSRLDACEDGISSLDTRVDAAEGNIAGLNTRMGTAEGNITGLNTRMDAAEGNIADLTMRVGISESAISALGNRTEALETWKTANDVAANVKQFGAVGDGVTDDTAAIQAALDTGYDVYFPCLNNETYLVTDTLVVDSANQTLYSDYQGRTIHFRTDDANAVLFDVRKPAKIEGITASRVKGDASPEVARAGIAVKATTDGGRNDTDVLVERCGFSGFATVIDYTGRGLYVARSQITSCDVGIHLKWLYDSDTSHGDIMSNALGHRSHRILSNRFHSVVDTCILIESNTPTNNVALNGISICDNMCDYGALYFIHALCSFRYGIIANNYIAYLTQRALYFEASVYDTVINGNNFYSDSRFRNMNHAITCLADVVGTSITGNVFSNMVVDCMRFEGQLNSSSIVGNVFNNITNYAIYCSDAWNRVAVIGNTGNVNADGNSRDFIHCSNSPAWNHVKATLNSCTCTNDVGGTYTGSNNTVKDNYNADES